jgi:trimethylamine--corrinoid protein Co-methyltransferase
MLPALAGANLIYGMGLLESGLTWDYGMLVLENEMVRNIMHIIKGFPVNDATMAHDVLAEVGPGGEFISHKHTFEHYKELSQTEILDRRNREAWAAAGSRDALSVAYDKAKDLIENFKPAPLPEGVEKQIHSILLEAEAETAEIKAKEKADRRNRRKQR